MNITVINGKTDGFIGKDKIYIGRRNRTYNLLESPLHNPYNIEKGVRSREDVIKVFTQDVIGWINDFKRGLLTPQMKELIRIYKLGLKGPIILT